jgi:hypothetical protein
MPTNCVSQYPQVAGHKARATAAASCSPSLRSLPGNPVRCVSPTPIARAADAAMVSGSAAAAPSLAPSFPSAALDQPDGASLALFVGVPAATKPSPAV